MPTKEEKKRKGNYDNKINNYLFQFKYLAHVHV